VSRADARTESLLLKRCSKGELHFVNIADGTSQNIGHFVRKNASSVELVHDHGAWLPNNIKSFKAARKHGLPFVLSTRGMMEPWALNHKKWKKKVAWSLYQKKILMSANMVHATSEQEAHHLRSLGRIKEICLIPNGVDFPEIYPLCQHKKKKRLLFVSRVHRKKGLMLLIEAWAQLRFLNWEVFIVGPNEGGHREELERYILQRKIEGVHFLGSLDDAQKWQAYADADVFVLPTHSENFGVVVAEAMAAGLPVVTTKGAPWEMFKNHGCGWWVDIDVVSIRNALEEAMRKTDAERAEMGKVAKKLAHEKFSWPQIGQEMNRVYDYILKKGPKPASVI
jgi:glycosyltransferase involved in cell wall biosynthesis